MISFCKLSINSYTILFGTYAIEEHLSNENLVTLFYTFKQLQLFVPSLGHCWIYSFILPYYPRVMEDIVMSLSVRLPVCLTDFLSVCLQFCPDCVLRTIHRIFFKFYIVILHILKMCKVFIEKLKIVKIIEFWKCMGSCAFSTALLCRRILENYL